MRLRIAMLLLALFCIGLMSQDRQRSFTAIVGVHVLNPDEGKLEGPAAVVVEGDRIVAVGKAREIALPSSARVIRVPGAVVLPGLAEMHGHIPPVDTDPQYIEDVLFLYVANGITTVRGMLGAPGQLQLREKANRGEIISPTLYLAGPSFNGNSINSPQEAVDKVRAQKAEGWDLLKIHPGLTLEEYDAMAQTADEVGIRFSGHIPADVGLAHALQKKQHTIDHLDGYMEYLKGFEGPVPDEKLQEAARMTLEADASVVPTLALWETILGVSDLEKLKNYAELRYMPPPIVRNWTRGYEQRRERADLDSGRTAAANRLRLLKVLATAKVPVLMGTDAPQLFSVPGFSLHREIAKLTEAGLRPWQIIQSGTSNVGRHFAALDSFGQIAVGQRADLMVVHGNPLDDLATLQKRVGVMVRGRWLSESFIQERLESIAKRHLEEAGGFR